MTFQWIDILGWNKEQLEELRLSGFSFLREGHYEKALIFFEGLFVLDNQNVYDSQTLGALYLQLGKKQKALSLLNHALTLDPHHEPTLLNKVKTLLALGQREEALAIAHFLEGSQDLAIAGDASALIIAYT